jgi:hypothetical protein
VSAGVVVVVGDEAVEGEAGAGDEADEVEGADECASDFFVPEKSEAAEGSEADAEDEQEEGFHGRG